MTLSFRDFTMASPPPPAVLDSSDARDPLTGVLTRRGLDAVAAGLNLPVAASGGSRSAATAVPSAYAVIVIDLDHFSRVNDQFGFESGDKVLQALVALMKSVLRHQDSVTRLGGEKFCVLLPGASTANAARVAERIRAEFNATPVVLNGATTALSLSAGVADSGSDEGGVLDRVLEHANEALLRAKAAGRNRVLTHAPRDGG